MKTSVTNTPLFHRRAALLAASALPVLLMCTACTLRSATEVREGLVLARLMKSMVPEMSELQRQELLAANEIRVVLDEAGEGDFGRFRPRFEGAMASLYTIRDRRGILLAKLRQAVIETAFARVVQADAVGMFQEAIGRDDSWILLATNIRLRSDLGRPNKFPEVPQLEQQLEFFVNLSPHEPLSSQVQALQAEYGFTEAEMTHN